MLTWLRRNLFTSRSNVRLHRRIARFLEGRYDSAVTSDNNRRHWVGADGLSANAANRRMPRCRNTSMYKFTSPLAVHIGLEMKSLRMPGEERVPRVFAVIRQWLESCFLQDVLHRLAGELDPEFAEFAHQLRVPEPGVLPHLNDQIADLFRCSWTPRFAVGCRLRFRLVLFRFPNPAAERLIADERHQFLELHTETAAGTEQSFLLLRRGDDPIRQPRPEDSVFFFEVSHLAGQFLACGGRPAGPITDEKCVPSWYGRGLAECFKIRGIRVVLPRWKAGQDTPPSHSSRPPRDGRLTGSEGPTEHGRRTVTASPISC